MKLSILFATQTGNAEQCAKSAQKAACERGFETTLSNIGDIDPGDLLTTSRTLFIVSTWGDGEPPDDAVPFFEKLQALPGNSLSHLNYGLFALGDNAYEHFCGFGQKLEQELNRCGACQVQAKAECDIGFEDQLQAWLPQVLETLAAPQSATSA